MIRHERDEWGGSPGRNLAAAAPRRRGRTWTCTLRTIVLTWPPITARHVQGSHTMCWTTTKHRAASGRALVAPTANSHEWDVTDVFTQGGSVELGADLALPAGLKVVPHAKTNPAGVRGRRRHSFPTPSQLRGLSACFR